MRPAIITLAFLFAAVIPVVAQSSVSIQQCWSDNDGNRHCGPVQTVESQQSKAGCTPDAMTKGCVMLLGKPEDTSTKSMHPRRWYRSKRFWALFALDVAATTVDYQTSRDGIARGGSEADPIFGSSRPSMVHMEAVGLPVAFGAEYLGYRLSAHHKFLSIIPTAVNIAGHVAFSVHNELTCRPSCGSAR
jgi:hypothetical protein